jgi:UTP-glucose-1-phosphate uridylyltransferase
MKKPAIEEVMTKTYKSAIKNMLLTQLKDDDDISAYFHLDSIERQRQIETEIEERAEAITSNLVSKLKAKGYLIKKPSDDVLRSLIVETLKEHGVSE